ncbi:tRNA-specific 2-thiouridylase MnmA [Clostridia bacterium]|nr:tRNA-specific 2-thiouridylase MnmA [Clostridia bacterium]
MKKVLVGMSGGVDSSVAAKLLIDSGFSVTGVTLKLFDGESSCCSLSDIEDARSVCIKLGIEHLVFNFKDYFEEYVIDHFVDTYMNGGTPNPCIECNRKIKFEKMLERAEVLGFDYIATGHYAKIENGQLKRAVDTSKDQTYVLYMLTKNMLAKTLFPLGDYTKTQIRQIAEENDFINAKKKDSQDICFVPDGDYSEFIYSKTKTNFPQGSFLDLQGNILGKSENHIKYTIGQRKGLGIAIGKPAYVIAKNVENNTVTLGNDEDLFTCTLIANDLNLLTYISENTLITAKTRYSQKASEAILKVNGDTATVKFLTPQRAITKGQAVVFYDGNTVIGGGSIVES